LIRNNPYETLSIFEDKLYWIAQEIAKDIDPSFNEKPIRFKIHLLPPNKSDSFKVIDIENLNKLIVLEGVVVSLSKKFIRTEKVFVKVEHYDTKKKSKKGNNDEEGEDYSHDGYYPELGKEFYNVVKLPHVCPVCGKRAKLTIDKSQSIQVNSIRAKLQERLEDVPAGVTPGEIDLILTGELIDKVALGEHIRIIGILKDKNELWITNSTDSDFYVKVLGIEEIDPISKDMKLSKEDEEKILELAKDPQIIDKIITSIGSSLYGLHDIREGIAVALFGAKTVTMSDGTTRRGDIHVLIIGEPATGKSTLAQAIMKIAPRSVYASGRGSTGVGLTASVTFDSELNRYVLNAGALPLANGGVCIIDEIDKMEGEDRQTIHTAMEQQIVEIHKAGINQKLVAKTTIIGIGNPIGGRFDNEKDVLDQINLDPAILSRFDLMFTTREDYTKEIEEKIKFMIRSQTMITNNGIIDKYITEAKIKSPIEADLLRKYIIYARQNIFPQWSSEAKKYLEEYTINLARKTQEDLKLQRRITERQIDSLRRISEAYARMRLSQEVTVDDVKRAINIFNKSLKSLGIDVVVGNGDIDKLMTGESEGDREVEKLVLQIIDSHTTLGGVVSYSDIQEELEKILESRHLDKGSIQKALERALAKLVNSGDIATVGSLNYKIVKPWHW